LLFQPASATLPEKKRKPIRQAAAGRVSVAAARVGGHAIDPLEIRPLTHSDAAAYQALRLRALLESPEAFGSSHGEEVGLPLEVVAQRLDDPGAPPRRVVVGAFAAGTLVGVAGCMQESKLKARHKAVVWGMYVAPEARRRGVGRALLARVIAQACTWPGVERLTLTVVTRAEAARRLYRAAGFRPFGLEPDGVREGGVRHAVEYLALDLPRTSPDPPA
jgi:ribosomal protein S18 acetylase RimI-like enzyme